MKYLMFKVVTGYGDDDYRSITSDELHKAYYLFLNADENIRSIMNDGRPLIGKDIKDIKPDYNAMMGWNPSYKPSCSELDEIKVQKFFPLMNECMQKASRVAQHILQSGDETLLQKPITEAGLLLT